MTKTGVSQNGRTYNTKKTKPITCDCAKCGWAKLTKYGDIYCKWLRQNNPQKEKCKKYYQLSELEDKKIIDSLKKAPKANGKILAKDITSYCPSFPWERKIGGDK